jgi:hypothetical protein
MTTATIGPSAPLGGQVRDNRRRDRLTGVDALEYCFDLLDCFLLGRPPSQRQQLLAHVGLHRLSRPARSPPEHLVKFFGHLAHLYRRHSAIIALQRQRPGTPASPAAGAERDPGPGSSLAGAGASSGSGTPFGVTLYDGPSQFVAYRASLFSEPGTGVAWQPAELEYAFALGSPTPESNLLLDAPDFPGGRLDWYSFTLQTADATPASAANPATVTAVDFAFLPNHVVFRGMHDPRWWTFEDSTSDFGDLDTQQVDIAKLLVMEFALVYGNDWFAVPVPTPMDALTRVTTLVVTDTFGVRTLIRPSEQTTVNTGETPWSMYKLSGAGTRSDFIMMAPTLGVVDDAAPVEDVRFLRGGRRSRRVLHGRDPGSGQLDSDGFRPDAGRRPVPPPGDDGDPDDGRHPERDRASAAAPAGTAVLRDRSRCVSRRPGGRPLFPADPWLRWNDISLDGPMHRSGDGPRLVGTAFRRRPRYGGSTQRVTRLRPGDGR